MKELATKRDPRDEKGCAALDGKRISETGPEPDAGRKENGKLASRRGSKTRQVDV